MKNETGMLWNYLGEMLTDEVEIKGEIFKN